MNLPTKYVIICTGLEDFYKVSDKLGIDRGYWEDSNLLNDFMNSFNKLMLTCNDMFYQYCTDNCETCGSSCKVKDHIFYKSSYLYRKEKLERINMDG